MMFRRKRKSDPYELVIIIALLALGLLLIILMPHSVTAPEPRLSDGNNEPRVIVAGKTTLLGVYECLPHRDQTGPQTEECSFGMKTAADVHYALDMAGIFRSGRSGEFTIGDRVIATGWVVPAEAVSSDLWFRYDVEGIMSVGEIEALGVASIRNFDECVAAGYGIMKSYPAQCHTPEGDIFWQEIPLAE